MMEHSEPTEADQQGPPSSSDSNLVPPSVIQDQAAIASHKLKDTTSTLSYDDLSPADAAKDATNSDLPMGSLTSAYTDLYSSASGRISSGIPLFRAYDGTAEVLAGAASAAFAGHDPIPSQSYLSHDKDILSQRFKQIKSRTYSDPLERIKANEIVFRDPDEGNFQYDYAPESRPAPSKARRSSKGSTGGKQSSKKAKHSEPYITIESEVTFEDEPTYASLNSKEKKRKVRSNPREWRVVQENISREECLAYLKHHRWKEPVTNAPKGSGCRVSQCAIHDGCQHLYKMRLALPDDFTLYTLEQCGTHTGELNTQSKGGPDLLGKQSMSPPAYDPLMSELQKTYVESHAGEPEEYSKKHQKKVEQFKTFLDGAPPKPLVDSRYRVQVPDDADSSEPLLVVLAADGSAESGADDHEGPLAAEDAQVDAHGGDGDA